MNLRTLPARLEDFVAKVNDCTAVDQAFAALLSRIQDLGFERLVYLVTWHPSSTVKQLCLTNHTDEWVDHYESERMDEVDLVGKHALTTVVPFDWNELLRCGELTKRERMVFCDAKEVGMRSGGTVPLHGPIVTKGLVSVSNDMDDQNFAKLFIARRHELQIISSFTHEKIMKLNLDRPIDKKHSLTKRECQILERMAHGKTRQDAAEILEIKESTVQTHLDSIRTKLGAANTANAIAIAITNGFIRP